MKIIGTKKQLIEKWYQDAAFCRELAAKTKSEKQRELYLGKAMILEVCATELSMLSEEKETK